MIFYVCIVCVSAEPGEYVVLLADRKLLELPLEALSILQDEAMCSVSRDFSLQLLHSRLSREEPDKGARHMHAAEASTSWISCSSFSLLHFTWYKYLSSTALNVSSQEQQTQTSHLFVFSCL